MQWRGPPGVERSRQVPLREELYICSKLVEIKSKFGPDRRLPTAKGEMKPLLLSTEMHRQRYGVNLGCQLSLFCSLWGCQQSIYTTAVTQLPVLQSPAR